MSRRQVDIILANGINAKGRNHYQAFAQQGRLSAHQSIAAKCYECCAGYADGAGDCMMPDCPLYPYHPYNPSRRKIVLSDEHKAKLKIILANRQ